METKDIILIVVSILSGLTAIAAFIFGIIQYKKNQKLEQERFLYQQEKDTREELKGEVEKFEKKKRKKNFQFRNITPN